MRTVGQRGCIVEDKKFIHSRRTFLRRCTVVGVHALLAACSVPAPSAPSVAPTIAQLDALLLTPTVDTAPATPSPAADAQPTVVPRLPVAPIPGPRSLQEAGGRQALIAKAQAEGELTVIGLPHDWLNYGAIIESFKLQYGIRVNELTPDINSDGVLAAVNQAALTREAIAPDVLDISFAFGQQAKDAALLQPYVVERWAEIPELLKDDRGYWAAGYYGVIAFAVNKAVVAQTPLGWTDLLKPIYTGQFAFTGDPHTANQAIQSVYAASLANGGSLDNAAPGLSLIAQLRDAGTLSSVMANPALFFQGDTPIISLWSFIAHALRIQAGSNPLVEVVVPKASVAGAYVQAINAYAPHPFAARLWLEHVFSDEVQMQWANAYAIPSRASALLGDQSRAGILTALGVTQELLAEVQIPTLTQMTAAKALIGEQWDSVVSFEIKAVD